MLSALFKAFTGRAGILASLLALLIIGVVAAAVVLGIPQIEQKLVTKTEAFLKANMAESDVLSQLSAEGRTLHIQGKVQDTDAFKQSVSALEGVQSLVFTEDNSVDIAQAVANQPTSSVVNSEQPSPATSTPEVIENTAENSVAPIVETQAVATSSDQIVSSAEVEHKVQFNQSTLSLRYDGPKLVLTGHLVDLETANLITAEVANAVPADYELEIDVDTRGASSSLSWLDNFLSLVAGLPGDAQGVIQGSDHKGVWIDADKVQSLFRKMDTQIEFDQEALDSVQINSNADSSGVIRVGMSSDARALADVSVQNQASEAAAEVAATDVTTQVQASLPTSDENTPDTQEAASEVSEQLNVDTLTPSEYILWLNKHLASNQPFPSGETEVSQALGDELIRLLGIMARNPSLLLRVVGNIDFSVDSRDGPYVGIDRARAIRDYMRDEGVDPFRVFAAPLPHEYAFEERVQVVFYISE